MLCGIISWLEICVFYEFRYRKVDILCIFQTQTKIDINRWIFIVKEVFYTPNKVSHGEHEYFGSPPPSNGTAL